MATSPPTSPGLPRPMSVMVKPAPRSNSRLSMTSKTGGGGGSRGSDEDGGRTSVKVAVRVRPALKPTDPGYELIPQRFQRSMVQTTSNTGIAIDAPQGKKLFVFDRVFGAEVTQEGIWEYLSESVNAFLQGYNVSLLAYGQSGAGKSYTMGTSGPSEQGDTEVMGVIPRAAMALFEKLDGHPRGSNRSSMSQLKTPARYSIQSPTPKVEKNWTLKATYVEIYNEQLRDLLVPDHLQPSERGNVTIREDTKGNILLTGLQQVDINSVDDLMNALNFGSTIRQTDATAINAKSSRSHAVFSLNLVQRKSKAQTAQGANKRFSVPLEAMTGTDTYVTTDSKLHFVDLAGSERLKNTGAQGERAREGISINAGLAALGKVISQLSSRQAGSHVSYRDSRLTRLLQDSLGGNAITYMIACVTPAEFHLSETLNTVQYAQRARAIQSKPRIQQVEEGDKQAIIERLKAEVAFLREQIRSAERSGGERRNVPATERSERQNERETELQNSLLDAQESYNTLSQRHAKLIAEMAKARNDEAAESQSIEDNFGDVATERLNRSNSFAQAVEQVVLEYEKTIQSLEQSLTSTRATLSNTETNLLEKETKCAYVETLNTQLHARLQKVMDREANTESYLHDLENKLDGHTSGEEKNATIVLELRKEIARIRENEGAAEDYISTLEERLAESDQDQELMQREIDRLEQVIERQRSLGKLDNLLHELDHIHQDGKPSDTQSEHSNGIGHRRTFSERSTKSHSSRPSLGVRGVLPEVAEGTEEDVSEQAYNEGEAGDREGPRTPAEGAEDNSTSVDYPPQSPAQTKFVADKLENVSEELVSLRVEHEATLNEYDMLHAKYDEALRALAELQDQVDEARHPNRQRDSLLSVTSPNQTRPSSFLSDARSSDIKDGTVLSRSLSSELSSAMDSPTTLDTPVIETHKPTESRETLVTGTVNNDNGENLAVEVERLKALAEEKQAAEKELADKYAELEERHLETLDMVEELKTEVAKAKYAEPPSPRMATPVIRRKSSQNVLVIDRAHRSFATLRNLAAENFEEQPDIMQNFDLNLNAAMHELHARSERIQELEADVATARKEMETKMTIISGLTRERSSLKSSPIDMSMVAALREQLERNEKQLQGMKEAHDAREKELVSELEALRTSINATGEVKPTSVTQTEDRSNQGDELRAAQEEKIIYLQAELSTWQDKHQAALDALRSAEEQMQKTISEFEAEIAFVNAKLNESQEHARSDEESKEVENRHQNIVTALRVEINDLKTIIGGNVTKVALLEQAHALAKEQLEEASKARDIASAESRSYQELVGRLEIQIEEHQKALKTHELSLVQLRDDHVKELNAISTASKEEYDAQVNELLREHAENIKLLESDAADARDELMKIATQVAFALGLDVSLEKISERIDYLIADQKTLTIEQHKSAELEGHLDELSAINNTIMRDLEAVKSWLNDMLYSDGENLKSPYPSVIEQLTAVKKRMADLENKSKKHSRLVEELEDQLQTNYDQALLTNNRLSTLQTERNMQLEEATTAKIKAQAELDTLRDEMAALQAHVDEVTNGDTPKRTGSTSSQVRKTASVVSLPSPPPAIPLPPLPPTGATSPTQGVPPTPTGGRPTSHDLALAQIREDQEARIQSIERHLKAERQLTATLEEALTDLENQSKKSKADSEAWRKRAQELETEVKELKERPQQDNRWRDSLHQIEEERKKRQDAERARTHLEERMNAINNKKKKKGSLNCF
ncbi:kinesin-domain-containing protein [Annulohypoxylon maeteangense]|uniref:kinesin-domain-containing protein n=1 Tax=Annulohypoxylon maeteangense TaxID=1927788 RepID=UPI0020081589|nr:kinesin-domain-containing protein [Annulohypoxylon maeteangense]KAI0880094.1 kinesin-domain-containing protein [Annulohypoxylon maeteangense]